MHTPSLLLLLAVLGQSSWANDTVDRHVEPLVETIQTAIADGSVIGAQLTVGQRDRIIIERSFGVRTPDGEQAVDSRTQFCIGSCSKPFASVCVLSLVDEGYLELDTPIDRWLPRFAEPTVRGAGRASRPPTLRELLAHRGGVFSQKQRMTEHQRSLIRDYSRTLEEAVDLIAREDLAAAPGTQYAYSGAGFCVLGRVAEVAASRPFDQILKERVCKPLRLTRTSYFPDPNDPNVAVGVGSGEPTDSLSLAPHELGHKLRLPLIGGSIYSTATETARFAQAIVEHGRYDDGELFSRKAWSELTRRQWSDQSYGLGWGLTFLPDSDSLQRMGHSGSLATSRSVIQIDLESGCYCVLHWTVRLGPGRATDPKNPRPIQQAVSETLDRFGV